MVTFKISFVRDELVIYGYATSFYLYHRGSGVILERFKNAYLKLSTFVGICVCARECNRLKQVYMKGFCLQR